MEKVKLKDTDLDVSRLCLGTMTFGGQADEKTAAAMVDCCIEAGINFIDTANVYTQGRSEEILGRILQGRRDRVVLASKVGLQEGGLSPAVIRREIDGSLQRLQTDCLDLYYMHAPDYDTPLEESLQAMGELVAAGKVRHVAASNFASWQMGQMRWLAEREGIPLVGVAQPMYNLIARGVETEFLPMCQELGLSTVAYNPLAGGLLTGKHRRQEPEAGGRFDLMANYRDRYWQDANFDAIADLAAACDQAGRSIISVAFAWLLHHTPTDCILVGASGLSQLEQNLGLAEEGPLDGDLLTACQQVWARVRGVWPQYNR